MTNILRKALLFAKKAHDGQLYGESPFITHPILTAQALEVVSPGDTNLIAAGYLHDIMEECPITWSELKRLFNEDIADLVEEVTKTNDNTFPKLHTRRGVLLLFISRGCNIAHIGEWSEEKQREYIAKSKFWKP